MGLSCTHLLGVTDLTKEDVELVLKTAMQFREVLDRPVKKLPTLRGKSVINLFFEASTRTRSSFELAAKRLGADAINFSIASSSVKKGETLKDTGLSLEAMRPDLIVVRHARAGAPHFLARQFQQTRIINGGDGMHQHPTQALLDALTIQDKKESFEGLTVVIGGDIRHSRVARSNAQLLRMMGAKVRVCAPPTLIPIAFEQYDVEIFDRLEEAVADADVVMMLRTQRERQNEVFYPSVKEYFRLYGLDRAKMSGAKPDAIVMHPGPINRGVEVDPELADSEYSVILNQVTNGVAIRMALLYLLIGSGDISQ